MTDKQTDTQTDRLTDRLFMTELSADIKSLFLADFGPIFGLQNGLTSQPINKIPLYCWTQRNVPLTADIKKL